MRRPDFEDLEVYQLAQKLANEIWHIVQRWDNFTKDTLGKQIVRSADSICANIAESKGRYNDQDNRRFVKIARGSLYETISLLRLAYARQLLTNEQVSRFKPILDELLPKLNAYLKSIGNRE
ncbi:four helix bundle protein [Nostoc sp. 'Lobaria pulmonaria (5183) cyanobiont']|uniref:four helix bundle protein n=1 Tax=Nostoc sp. 'Lobaria pulmonaria (5183) cyanobiont' TaxID=1618022 RepID=UPI000CF3131C|nr:four helix bundle protein [Nostoc sp. 'Lobaria pulmonaria (5183) cyanobiont']AVH74122.1 23S rRNA-intervening sequence protein [Nostoc sp. 'Lobaria pulmonaria (5183) cyanobiont']